MKVSTHIEIGGHKIGPGYPAYIVAEVSANHNQRFDQAVEIIRAAKEAGADAVKLQTYTSDTMTIQCDTPDFLIAGGTPWDGKTLFDLYNEAYMPWEWQPKLKKVADDLGIDLFSTPFDRTAVDFLEDMGVPVYKIASFEMVDLPLIQYVASKGKPLIMSTGLATLTEIGDAVEAARTAGASQIALLKCTSAYPALPDDMNLRTIPHLSEEFGAPVGLSDHTSGIAVPIAAVALGACILEKHLTLSRSIPSPDASFSLEPQEFGAMVDAVRTVEKALGEVRYQPSEREAKSRVFRRSLFVVRDMKAGEVFTAENVRSIRPGHGISPRHIDSVHGCLAAADIKRGTPLKWELVNLNTKRN